MNFQSIRKFTQIYYRVSLPWDYLLDHLTRYVTEYKLDLNPDFQRGHVWTEQQQIRFVEFALKEPQSGLEIFTNHPGWMTTFKGDFVLVDGKQRLEAALRFLKNEIPAYDTLYKDFTGFLPINVQFYLNVAKLKTRAEVLQWYLDFNAGGTPHTQDEIEKVKKLLEVENHEKESHHT